MPFSAGNSSRRVSHQGLVASALFLNSGFLLGRSGSLGLLAKISTPVPPARVFPELREAGLAASRWEQCIQPCGTKKQRAAVCRSKALLVRRAPRPSRVDVSLPSSAAAYVGEERPGYESPHSWVASEFQFGANPRNPEARSMDSAAMMTRARRAPPSSDYQGCRGSSVKQLTYYCTATL